MGVFDVFKDTIDDFTGKTASDAAKSGAKTQSKAAVKAAQIEADAGERALALLRGDLEPFREGFGAEQIAGLSGLASDPSQQAAFLQNNPFFEQLKGDIRESTFRTQSAGGDLGGSGTDEIISNQFLRAGSDLINQQINRQLPLLQSAQNAAAQSGTQGAQIIGNVGAAQAGGVTGAANARAAGLIGSANARAQGTQNIISTGLGVAGLFSDERLKTNIKKIGEKSGINVYSWDWNNDANDIGLKGSSTGHIAQQVQKIHPELVQEMDNGYLAINYSTDKTVRLQ